MDRVNTFVVSTDHNYAYSGQCERIQLRKIRFIASLVKMLLRQVRERLPAIFGLVGFFWLNAKIISIFGAGIR